MQMNDGNESVFETAVSFTRDRSPASFDQWFSGVQFDGLVDGVLSLRARDEFVVGPSNQLAHAASIAAAGGGGRRHNPLFICGGTGLGKTHLVHGVAHRVRSERPSARIVYISAERFVNEFVQALQDQKMGEF